MRPQLAVAAVLLAAAAGVTAAGPASAAPARPWVNAALTPEDRAAALLA